MDTAIIVAILAVILVFGSIIGKLYEDAQNTRRIFTDMSKDVHKALEIQKQINENQEQINHLTDEQIKNLGKLISIEGNKADIAVKRVVGYSEKIKELEIQVKGHDSDIKGVRKCVYDVVMKYDSKADDTDDGR